MIEISSEDPVAEIHGRLERVVHSSDFDDMLNELRDHPFKTPSYNGTRSALMDRWIIQKGIAPLFCYEYRKGTDTNTVVVLGLDETRYDENTTIEDIYTKHLDEFDALLPPDVKTRGIDPTNVLFFLCPPDYLHKLRPYVQNPEEVYSFYRGRAEEEYQAESAKKQAKDKELEVFEDTTQGAVMLENIVRKLIKLRGSDIHLETNHGNHRVRYRVDGKLVAGTAVHTVTKEEVEKISEASYKQLVGAIRAKSKGIIFHEHRLPQDGGYEVPTNILREHNIEGDYQFRVATVPTPYGEDVVMRIHEKGRPMPLDKLGFLPEITEALARLAKRPNGIILATGPTGSGKTTTLYSMIQAVNHASKKIITFEDPIERDIMGLEQIQVRADIDLTFARLTSAALRYDPDIMLIGEMKDDQTAEAAIRAALTGHLVYSTLHTNDAASSILRLGRMLPQGGEIDMQATLRAVLAQRLVRTLVNEAASESIDISPQLTRLTGIEFDYPIGLPSPKVDSAYRGRVPVGELFIVNDEARDCIVKKDFSVSTYRRIAEKAGMITLLESGLRMAIGRTTSLDEIVDLVGEDEFREKGKIVKAIFDKHYRDKK